MQTPENPPRGPSACAPVSGKIAFCTAFYLNYCYSLPFVYKTSYISGNTRALEIRDPWHLCRSRGRRSRDAGAEDAEAEDAPGRRSDNSLSSASGPGVSSGRAGRALPLPIVSEWGPDQKSILPETGAHADGPRGGFSGVCMQLPSKMKL